MRRESRALRVVVGRTLSFFGCSFHHLLGSWLANLAQR